MLLEASLDACDACCSMEDERKPQKSAALGRAASFIRAHDLDLSEEDLAGAAIHGDEQRTDAAIVRGQDILSVAKGGSSGGAIASALALVGLREATDESDRWTATGGTDRILQRRARRLKKGKKPLDEGPAGPWKNAASGRDVLVWSSKCVRPGHGSDYPVVRSRGLVPASAKDVVDLVRDSGRVTEYNKVSIGREDQAVLTREGGGGDVHCPAARCPALGVPGEAKIMSSKSQPPLVRKPLEFKTLFYARRLTDADGVETDGVAYITVGRSVWESPEGTDQGSDGTTTRCELMLSVNLVRDITAENGEAWCELTMVTHAVSPGVPVFIGKQLGLVAAENYIKDVRALFEK